MEPYARKSTASTGRGKKVTATKSGGTLVGCAAAHTFVVKNLDSASFVEE